MKKGRKVRNSKEIRRANIGYKVNRSNHTSEPKTMAEAPRKRVLTPGKKVSAQARDNNHDEDSPERKVPKTTENNDRDMTVLTVKEIKNIKFSIFDHHQKFFGKVIYIVAPRTHKSVDVHFHRRRITIADHTDYISGYVRHNDDNFLKENGCYMFSKFKLFKNNEILVHEKSTKMK